MQNREQKEITIFDDWMKNAIKFIPQWITPNHITFLRLILMIIVIWLFASNRILLSFIIFLIASTTDAVDGVLARQRHQITKFGSTLDPLIDKLLIITLLILFANYLPWQIIALVIATELLIILGSYVLFTKHLNIKANLWGKLKMSAEILAVILIFIKLILRIDLLDKIIILILVLSICLASISFIKQFNDYKKMVR